VMLLFDDDPSGSCNRCHARAYAREGAIWRARERNSARARAQSAAPIARVAARAQFSVQSAFSRFRRFAPLRAL